MNCQHTGRLEKYSDGSARCKECERLITPNYNTQIAALRSQLATVTAEREAMREAIGNLFIIIGNHTGDEIKCDRITEKMWIAEAYALKGGKG